MEYFDRSDQRRTQEKEEGYPSLCDKKRRMGTDIEESFNTRSLNR